MGYTPKLPPLAAEERGIREVAAGSLPSRKPVTTVTAVTPGRERLVAHDDEEVFPDRQALRICFSCSGQEWWRRSDGPWICTVCHPPADVAFVAERSDHFSR